jgi:hypothetical protein
MKLAKRWPKYRLPGHSKRKERHKKSHSEGCYTP